MTSWSDPPTAFQIEYLEPNREIGPTRALWRSDYGPYANSKGKAKGKYKAKDALKGGRGNVYVARLEEFHISSDSEIESSGPRMPPLATASNSSSDSYEPPPVGYSGILSILNHY